MPLWKIILGVYIGGVIAFTAHAHFFDEYYRHLGLIPNLGRGLLWFVFCLPLIGKTVCSDSQFILSCHTGFCKALNPFLIRLKRSSENFSDDLFILNLTT